MWEGVPHDSKRRYERAVGVKTELRQCALCRPSALRERGTPEVHAASERFAFKGRVIQVSRPSEVADSINIKGEEWKMKGQKGTICKYKLNCSKKMLKTFNLTNTYMQPCVHIFPVGGTERRTECT